MEEKVNQLNLLSALTGKVNFVESTKMAPNQRLERQTKMSWHINKI